MKKLYIGLFLISCSLFSMDKVVVKPDGSTLHDLGQTMGRINLDSPSERPHHFIVCPKVGCALYMWMRTEGDARKPHSEQLSQYLGKFVEDKKLIDQEKLGTVQYFLAVVRGYHGVEHGSVRLKLVYMGDKDAPLSWLSHFNGTLDPNDMLCTKEEQKDDARKKFEAWGLKHARLKGLVSQDL